MKKRDRIALLPRYAYWMSVQIAVADLRALLILQGAQEGVDFLVHDALLEIDPFKPVLSDELAVQLVI